MTVPDSSVTLPTLCDVRKLSEFKMATTTSGFYNSHLEFQLSPTSGNVDKVISESGMIETMGVEVEIAAPSHTVEKLFPLPV